MGLIITTSWDDGNKADIIVSKLLKKYGLKGTFYIPIHHENRNLNNFHIKRISRKFEIGSHGMFHRRLVFLDNNKKIEEILGSKEKLEEIIEREVKCFAYPYGVYDRTSVNYVKDAGYIFARSSKEFCFERPKNPLKSGVSLALFNRPSRVLSPKGFAYFTRKMPWHKIAKSMLDKVPEKGVFHIFGHSWQIEKNNEWDVLETLFDYISSKKNYISLTNSEIVGMGRLE